MLELKCDDPALLQDVLDDGTTLEQALSALMKQHPDPHGALLAQRGSLPIGWLDLPAGGPWVEQCAAQAKRMASEFDSLIVCGIGGSALGAQAVYRALDLPGWRLRKVHVLDNIDPTAVSLMLEEIDLQHCAINVISKSGETLETMAAFFYLLEQCTRAGLTSHQIAERIVATTDSAKGLLRPYADECGWATLPVPPDVGGRFSVFSAVGLLPLAFAGVDTGRLLEGAKQLQERCVNAPAADNPAWRLALVHYLEHMRHGKNIAVQYIYGDPLLLLGDWWRQLWAESLAKRQQLDGKPSEVGQTPVVARGATDQHSQNQLYFDGPDDKLYTLLTARTWAADESIHLPSTASLDELAYLNRHTFGDILEASRKGVRDALRAAGRPVYEIILRSVSEIEVGAYMQLWMLATAYAGQLYNVNPFDQPGVEKNKKITKQRLNSGF
jgi:glucose-6-phosphate isomerase